MGVREEYLCNRGWVQTVVGDQLVGCYQECKTGWMGAESSCVVVCRVLTVVLVMLQSTLQLTGGWLVG